MLLDSQVCLLGTKLLKKKKRPRNKLSATSSPKSLHGHKKLFKFYTWAGLCGIWPHLASNAIIWWGRWEVWKDGRATKEIRTRNEKTGL